MKIAWFHSHLLHPNSGGSRYVLDYSAELQELYNHEVTIFCDIASEEARQMVKELNIKLVELDKRSTNSPLYWLMLKYTLHKKKSKLAGRINKYDLIVNSMFPMNLLVSDFSLPKVQVCYEPFAFFYDKGFLENFRFYHRAFFRIIKLFFVNKDKAAVKKMDKILTVNKTNIPKIKNIYDVSSTPVYAGIDTDMYKPAPSDDINKIRAKHLGAPLLFHSTDLTGIKGSYPLLDVLVILKEKYPDIKLLFTVYLDLPEETEKFRARINALKLSRNTEFLGCLPKTDLPLYYSSVDLVCQPSINQPANWPLKESLLCGTPIVGGLESEEVVDFVNGCKVDIRETTNAAEKLVKLFENHDQLTVCTEELVNSYSIKYCISRFNDILEVTYGNYKNN